MFGGWELLLPGSVETLAGPVLIGNAGIDELGAAEVVGITGSVLSVAGVSAGTLVDATGGSWPSQIS